MTEDSRNPDILLSRLKDEELRNKRGRLKIFFGAVAGVGKTYSMLEAARNLKGQAVDVIVGYVETHDRQETEALLAGLEMLPRKLLDYRGIQIGEFDIDAALTRKPEVILVDELAHTNAPGSRHAKRWQDVAELLEAGIDVFTTLNVQHVESLNDVVAQITKVAVRERVPDTLLEKADIELVDLPPEELLERLREGKVYVPATARVALENFFQKGNLIALRELVLRYTADRVIADMEQYRQNYKINALWPVAERILVCISPSPLAARLVRSGKRMADALRAKWLVVYVEGPRQVALPDADRSRLNSTLHLAEQLGAETLELSGMDVADVIIQCARQYNVSKIVIGKPARPRWQEILWRSVVDEVVRGSGPTDVYVITGEGETTIGARRAPSLRTRSSWVGYLIACLSVASWTVIAQTVMLPHLELSNVVITYLLVIVIVATRLGRGPSILASFLSVALFDFFCVPPLQTFVAHETQSIVTFFVMLTVSLIVSNLTVTIMEQADAARLRETRTAALYSMSRELSSSLDTSSILEIGLHHIGNIFESKVNALLPASDGQLKIAARGLGKRELSNVDAGVAVWAHRNRQLAGLGTDTLPGAQELYVPLLGSERSIGVLAIRPEQQDRFLSLEQLRLLETFANHLALAYERAQLSDKTEQAKIQIKTEQLRSSLLSSVSHDLRTPLATIAGAASSIVQGTEALDMSSCKEMAREIYHESMRLNRLVTNLLDMTKLESGLLRIAKELHSADDLIATALSSMKERLAHHQIKVLVGSNVPPVLVDETLMQQVLVNLIENSAKYAPPGTEIQIGAEPRGDMVVISVADQGPGIPENLHARVFEKFYRENVNNASGAGLGLPICSGVVEAHGGKIWVENKLEGSGSIFKFTVPAGKPPPPDDFEDEPSTSGTDHG